jgi:N-sulfoglucosamine sulfohydrolase
MVIRLCIRLQHLLFFMLVFLIRNHNPRFDQPTEENIRLAVSRYSMIKLFLQAVQYNVSAIDCKERMGVNFLYIHTHDSGRYLDPSNCPVPLTGVESLTESSVTFKNAFSAAPTCSPSRSALLTGRWPHSNGMAGLAHRGFELNDESIHWVRHFNQAGYETVLCGVQHVAGKKEDLGYQRILDGTDDYFNNPESASPAWDEHNADLAVEYLQASHDRPFYLSLGLHSTHRPFPPVPESLSPRDHHRPPEILPDLPETRFDMEGFLTSLQTADRMIGRVVEALKSSGRWEDTVVLLTTDHGPAFPDMKGTLYDGGIGVALCLRVPGFADDGRLEHAMISQIDIYPTVCRLFDLALPENIQGLDLNPLLRGEAESVRRYIYAETSYHAAYEPARCIRSGRYKLVRHYGPDKTVLPVNVDDSSSKKVWDNAGYFRHVRSKAALFDLHLDPGERHNLVDSDGYGEIQNELSRELEDWMIRTDDPIRSGRMPRPFGSRLNRREAWSASEETYE